MSDEEAPKKKGGGGGAPLWMATFADLMSLLLAFFVLLFSFAEMESDEFSQRGGALAVALGVQTETPVFYKVQGTNPAARKFSSEPSKMSAKQKIVQEFTTRIQRIKSMKDDKDGGEGESGDKSYGQKIDEVLSDLKNRFSAEIFSGLVEVELEEGEVVIRLQEKLFFPPSGIIPEEDPWNALVRLHQVLKKATGRISIKGYTDRESLVGTEYRSLYDLGAARTGSVAEYFIKHHLIDDSTIQLVSRGNSNPKVTKGTREERGKNRRVEIVVSDLIFIEKEAEKKVEPIFLQKKEKELRMVFDPRNPGSVEAKFFPADDGRISLEESLE
jgi:chemotaxis protein MotB